MPPNRVCSVSITWSVGINCPPGRSSITVIAPDSPTPSEGAEPTRTKLRPPITAVPSAVGVMMPIPSATPRLPVATSRSGSIR